MDENFPKMEKKYLNKSRKCRVPGRINSRRNTMRHTKVKDKDKILKATREK